MPKVMEFVAKETRGKSITLDTLLQCAIALSKRNFAFEVLLDILEQNVVEHI